MVKNNQTSERTLSAVDENWASLIGVLQDQWNPICERQEAYLKSAFDHTERLWQQQFEQIECVKFVLFSEAPLFGTEKAYIYNPESKFTAFFYFNDLLELDGCQDLFQYSKRNVDFIDKKKAFIDKLNELGILIFDIFPFALNSDDTGDLNYRKLSAVAYRELFAATAPHYFEPKLREIRTKCSEQSVFATRYKRLHESLLAFEIDGINLGDLKCIASTNMSMSRCEFHDLYYQSSLGTLK